MNASDIEYLDTIAPKVDRLAYTIVHHLFTTMLNPRNRGPAWKWEAFPEFCERHAEATCWGSFPEPEWKLWQDKIKQDIRALAWRYAKECLDDSDILNWWDAS